jgi:hypothetical protein
MIAASCRVCLGAIRAGLRGCGNSVPQLPAASAQLMEIKSILLEMQGRLIPVEVQSAALC